jgi:hypothetical protein
MKKTLHVAGFIGSVAFWGLTLVPASNAALIRQTPGKTVIGELLLQKKSAPIPSSAQHKGMVYSTPQTCFDPFKLIRTPAFPQTPEANGAKGQTKRHHFGENEKLHVPHEPNARSAHIPHHHRHH